MNFSLFFVVLHMNIYQTYKYAVFCIEVYMSEQTFKKMVFKFMFNTANNKAINNIIEKKKTLKITTVIQKEEEEICEQNTKTYKKTRIFWIF